MKDKNNAIRWGLTVFATVAAILLFYDTLFGRRVLLNITRQFLRALQPVIIGGLLAYLLAPAIDFIEDALFSGRLKKAREGGKLISRGARAVSLVLVWVMIGLLLYLLGHVLLPQLYQSVVQLVSSVETYYNTVSGWVERLLESNLLVGAIVSVYFMATKERCTAHARKLTYSLFSRDQVYWIFRGAARADSIFAGFVRGKLLDSLIIGVLCFIGCSVLKMPYTPLVSVFVGVTNVIPFFGPFLGAIPSLFLILLVNPLKALYFLLFVLALQQLDGNVIGPKILGDSTGLSSLWVIIAILVGGSFFGVAGMFFGVPVCACLYNLVAFMVDRRLAEKDLPVESTHYTAPLPESEKQEKL